MWINRLLRESVVEACATRPALLVGGARQTGKSSLLRRILPDVEYVTLDRVALAAEAEESPSRFLDRFKRQVILDEIQYAPALFRELKIRIDADRQAYGRWILTGSQRFQLMAGISESLAGRIGLLQLETLAAKELRDSGHFVKDEIETCLWRGGYPELWANSGLRPQMFYEDYIQTYLERDLKALVQVSNIRDFQRFIQICATRAGQLLNLTDMAKDIGVSAKTIKSWIGALEASGIVYLLPPYFANVGKRLAKSPKLYFSDNGLLAHLLNITNRQAYERTPTNGQIWENLVFTEIIKTLDVQPGRNLFFYRDQNAVEMDFVIELGGRLFLIEAKSGERVDSRKLNFQKVAKLFPSLQPQCLLMCSTPEETPVHLAEYAIVNPLLHNLDSEINEGKNPT
jgi:predicted AAA+ superfamily ATPase